MAGTERAKPLAGRMRACYNELNSSMRSLRKESE